MQSVHLPTMVTLQPIISTGYTQEDKASDKLFTLSLENQMQHQSPLRAAKESTACTSATVNPRWVLATNVSTSTLERMERDTPSVTCVLSERTHFVSKSLAIRIKSGQISLNIMQSYTVFH